MVRVGYTFLLLGLASAYSYPCAVRREIAPCTCRLLEPKLTTIAVACEQMSSFSNIVEVLNNRFPSEQDISLKISFSQLDDLVGKSFKDFGMSVSSLTLSFDSLSYLNDSTFTGLEGVESLSLADNKLVEVPRLALRKMPNIKTLDLGRSRISNLLNEDFAGLPKLATLVLVGNTISYIESNSIPFTVTKIHLARNDLKDLNGSLRALTQLEWMFINGNQLTSLKDQLALEAPKLRLIHAANNHLRRLPIELLNYHFIDTLFFMMNDIEGLDGILQRGRKLKLINFAFNKITTLAEDEFAECDLMDTLELSHNQLQALNRAFTPLKRLKYLNLSYNLLQIFSINEIRGLRGLKYVDLSYNRIQRITDHIGNQVELETRVEELHLENNELSVLDGALQGIHGLQRLYLSHNQLKHISPDDLIGLDELEILDISHNQLASLDDTSKTFLPQLQELIATNNHFTSLANEFHGLPVLCIADMSFNKIRTIGKELASMSYCRTKVKPGQDRYRNGMLMISIDDNPIICKPEFKELEDYMKINNTFMKADMTACETMTTTAFTSTVTTTTMAPTTTTTERVTATSTSAMETTTTTTTAPSIDLVKLILSPLISADSSVRAESAADVPSETNTETPSPPSPLAPQVTLVTNEQRSPLLPPQVIPLSFSPELLKPIQNKSENAIIESPEDVITNSQEKLKIEFESASSPMIEKQENAASGNQMSSIVVVKDEGKNITLVIPMENGEFKKDHAADHYTQDEDGDSLNRTTDNLTVNNRPAITNIEIVEINPLPQEPPTLIASDHDGRPND